jgi:serine/threonine protein phosphatase 1
MSNRWVISDVHGCYQTLLKLLDRIGEYDFIYFTGDLCDRGLFTRDVIELVSHNPKMDSVLGNHDQLFSGLHYTWTARHGSIQTLASYGHSIPETREHREWLAKRPLYIELDDAVISHSGNIHDPWDRTLPQEHNGKVHICGHTPLEDVKVFEHGVMIDTACFYEGKLTAYNIDTKTWISEPMVVGDSMWKDRPRRLSE